MIPDVSINGLSMFELGWLRENVEFPTPKAVSEYVVVPGRNTPIRYTNAFGKISYEPRSFTITLSMLGTRSEYDEKVSQVVNKIVGRLCQVICSESPELYVVGTIQAEPSYDALSGRGTLVLTSEDGDSYRYHTTESQVAFSGSGIVLLPNDFMPVVPKIVTTDETTLAWKVGSDSFQKTLSAGEWEIPELELKQGDNTVNVTTEGPVTFRYREGRL